MKNRLFLVLLLVLIVFLFSKNAFLSLIKNADIDKNVRQYSSLIIDAVNDFETNGTFNEDLTYQIKEFINKYKHGKVPQKGLEKITVLSSLLLDYTGMYAAKRDNNPTLYNKFIDRFNNDSQKIKEILDK